MKVPGSRNPFVGVIPPQQRLGAAQLAGHQAHLGLVGELELVADKRFGERFLRIDTRLMLRGQASGEQAMLAAAA